VVGRGNFMVGDEMLKEDRRRGKERSDLGVKMGEEREGMRMRGCGSRVGYRNV